MYIRAIGVGTARIYATATDGSECSDYLTVTVSNSIPVTSVTLDRSSFSLEEGHCTSLSATVCPDNATNKNINWTSSNNAIATVCDGVVTAVAKGSARITATAADGSGKSDYCSVNVTSDVLVSSITVIAPNKKMTVGDSAYFTASVLPINATKKSVCWSSENSDIASVNPDSGLVYAKAAGTTTIYATACDGGGIEGCCQITVTPRIMVTSIEVDPSTKTMHVGDICYCFFAMAYPATATDRRIRWSSCDCTIADVDSVTGIVTARAVGTTFIYANAIDGSGISGYCEVTILPLEATSVTLNKTTATLSKEETVTLKYIVSPHKATVTSVSWESDANSIASVSNGVVTANKDGVANITVTINGNLTATCKVIVDSREKVTVERDGNFNKIVFKNTNKTWYCINCDMLEDSQNANNDTLKNRLYKNTYATIVKDSEGLIGYYDPISYSCNEMKLIYAIDPYGFSKYVHEYAIATYVTLYEDKSVAATTEQAMLSRVLGFKDSVFKILFGRDPDYYMRTVSGTWIKTQDRSELDNVISESELYFGRHPIYDLSTGLEIVGFLVSLAGMILGCPQIPMNTFVKGATIVHKYGSLVFFAGKSTIQSDFNGFVSALTNHASGEITEDTLNEFKTHNYSLCWAYDMIGLSSSLESIKRAISDKPHFYNYVFDVCTENLNYSISFEYGSNQTVNISSIRDLILMSK